MMMTGKSAATTANRNVSRALGLVLLALSLSLGLAACDRLLSADRRIERAAVEFEAGQYAAAMNDVKTALEVEPGNVEGRVLLARISLRLGDAESARKELDHAIQVARIPRDCGICITTSFCSKGVIRTR